MQPEVSTDKKISQLPTVIQVRLYSRVAQDSSSEKPNPQARHQTPVSRLGCGQESGEECGEMTVGGSARKLSGRLGSKQKNPLEGKAGC